MARRYVAKWVDDADRAEDVYQGAVQAILESRKGFCSLAHLRNYFFVALRNAAIDELRARGRSPEVSIDGEALARLAVADASGPRDRLLAEEEAERLRARLARLEAAIDRLPPADRDLLRWRFWERKSFREIGERVGAPISTLKSREDRILRQLQKTVGKDEVGA